MPLVRFRLGLPGRSRTAGARHDRNRAPRLRTMPVFTPHQDDAIRWKNLDACVVAGPGSGKTTVLVERYRTLVEQHGLDPRNILAITFTEKAAANMKAKLADLF